MGGVRGNGGDEMHARISLYRDGRLVSEHIIDGDGTCCDGDCGDLGGSLAAGEPTYPARRMGMAQAPQRRSRACSHSQTGQREPRYPVGSVRSA